MGASLIRANMNHHAMYTKPARLPEALAHVWVQEGLDAVGGLGKVAG